MKRKSDRSMDILFLFLLAVYPLRHIAWGLDLWDTGYNYANFAYMGVDHMDPMWLFSTYLATAAGHLMTLLPFGRTLLGMNFYTGLTAGALGVLGYLFCTRKWGIPRAVSFLGEFAALNLCWCPTALLYNYLTYLFLLGCVALLYSGLAVEGWTPRGRRCLFGAGVCLGCNVLVRFSNLPEAALILAVWVYAFLEAWAERRESGIADGKPAEKCVGFWRRCLRTTGWCLGGYLSALAMLFGWIHLRYGLGNYIAGIRRLWAMTDTATDYKATSMVRKLLTEYFQNLYWADRILLLLGGAWAVGIAAEYVAGRLEKAGNGAAQGNFDEKTGISLAKAVRAAGIAFCVGTGCFTIFFLVSRKFCSLLFDDYSSMRQVAIVFILFTYLVAAIRILTPSCPREEKLISGMLALVLILTSLGSNNGVLPSANNLFLAAPYMLWQFVRLCGKKQVLLFKGKLAVPFYPAKCVWGAFLLFFLFQIVGFGTSFSFVEAHGAQNVTETVENNTVLAGVRMSPERAEWMEEISAYAQEKRFAGREVILYGYIPSLSFYLEMPSAFNPWSDLASYGVTVMAEALEEETGKIRAGGDRPVVILDLSHGVYYEEGRQGVERLAAEREGITSAESMERDKKWGLLMEYLKENGYGKTFVNEKFMIWE